MSETLCTLRTKGGGGGKYKETSLWTNPSPSADFAAQTVTLSDSIDNYKYIKIKYCFSASYNTGNYLSDYIISVDEFKKSPYPEASGTARLNFSFARMNTSNVAGYRRFYYASSTTVRFGSTDTNALIPLEILGLNELKYKPDDYIVTSGTFSIASLSTPVTVTIGFKPKKLTAWRVSASNNFESFTYDDSISTTTYVRIMVANGSNINGGTRNIGQSQTNDLISINNDGFTLASGVATGTWNYFATGVAE